MLTSTLFRAKAGTESSANRGDGQKTQIGRPIAPAARPKKRRMFQRAEPSTFHRFLAVHMHFAERAGALD